MIRKWVFPILRLIILAAIAAALVKFAFFTESESESVAEVATGTIAEPMVEATVGTVRNEVVLDGMVSADEAVAIRATLSGEVRETFVSKGQWVDEGTDILQIRGVNEDGSSRWVTVKAPIAGVMSSFDLLVGQSLTIGTTVGMVAPPSFNVSAALAPEQQYRLTTQPTEAQVAVSGGPAPFTCTGLTITTPLAVNATPSSADDALSTSAALSATVRCAVPSDVRVFAGLAGRITIAGGLAEDVVVIPTTAVEGGGGTGIVYVGGKGGNTVQREVTLGLSDGTNVQVTSGLQPGEMVLQFVPGAPADIGTSGGDLYESDPAG